MTTKTLYLVHCVDTEGPLYESPQATIKRVNNTFGLDLPVESELLPDLKKGIGVPASLKAAVMDFVSDLRLNYNRTWDEVDRMLDEILSPDWRQQYRDDLGQGYLFNWFVLDHVGFRTNPRRRALGYHGVYEHYVDKLREHRCDRDRIYWHFHPVSFCYEAHKTSNNFSFTDEHLQVLSRRLIDHLDFPAAFRPGSHTERPDINLFLEMWIPFDYGNQGMAQSRTEKMQRDIADGRYGDWRRATDQWETYHPDFYDYQKKGAMKRYVARALNLESRVRPITTAEIEKAFQRTDSGRDTILAITNHDEREMRPATDWYMTAVRDIQQRFPTVQLVHTDAVDAIRKTEGLSVEQPARLDFLWEGSRLVIKADKAIWGPQPYFCFATRDRRYLHENLDRQDDLQWSFVFDTDTLEFDQLEWIGVATNDDRGNTSVYRMQPGAVPSKTDTRYRNTASESGGQPT
ncbi:MAG: hypothetical protein [Olavius algarvensis Delta 4 endosymbiont]|nr:MAG: hypothetical protein [Olavius algarvensis Delta 4 endosymbiont]